MNYRLIFTIIFIPFIYGCDQSQFDKKNKTDFKYEKRYKNTGFALIYEDGLKEYKKLDNRSLNIYHKKLRKRSMVKITNLKNGKSLIAEVKSNKVIFSEFYNSVITQRIVENLELNPEEPYVEIALISKNSTFIAKKSKTFDEEKKVAEKAPIDGIQINDLNKVVKLNVTKTKNQTFSYSIKVADFFYLDTAKMMIDRINKETPLKNSRVIKISKTRFRVLIGPFNDIKSLEESFEKMKSLNFENIEILKNV